MYESEESNQFREFAKRVEKLNVNLPEVELIYNAMESHMRIQGKTKHLFVTGPSNVGKTRMAENFKDRHKAYTLVEDDETEVDVTPVILMETPHPFTLLEFYHELIFSLGAPRLSGVPRVNDLKTRAYDLIDRQKVKMIIIDEINNIMTSGFNKSSAMDTIKHLANKTNVTLVLMGTPEAKELRKLDEQYKSRYRLRSIQRFKKCDDEFCDYLMKIEKQLEYPMNIGLGNKETGLPQLLHYQSKGKVGFLIPIIQEAFDILGVNDDSFNDFSVAKLTADVLNEAYNTIQGDVFDEKLDEY